MRDATLVFQCEGCRLQFTVPPQETPRQGSDDDFCCPLCRSTRLLLFVEVDDDAS